MKGEADLLRAARRLDQEALIEIFDTYAPGVFRYVLRLCHDPVESDNIVGDVFTQLMEQFAAGNGPLTNLRSYLYQTAYHLIVDQARRNQRVVPLEVVIDTPGKLVGKSTQTRVEERELMETLVFAMENHLSDIQRHVIILRFLEDFSLGETAVIVGKSVTNVKVIQSRGIAKLRKTLGFWHTNPDKKSRRTNKFQ